MADQSTEPSHGHSPAAWTAVVIMLLGFTVGTAAFFFEMAWLVWVSVGIVIVGGLSGFVLAKAGYGVYGPKFVAKEH